MSKKMNSQAVGLDIGLSFIKWLTGAEKLQWHLDGPRGYRREFGSGAICLHRKTVFLSTIWVIAHFGCGRRCG